MQQNRNTKSKVVKYGLPCPSCKSSDAYSEYDDGHGYCFSCSRYTPPDDGGPGGPKGDVMTEQNYSFQSIDWRGIDKRTLQKYGVKAKVSEDGGVEEIHYPLQSKVLQIRKLKFEHLRDKWRIVSEKMPDGCMFGVESFGKGSSKSITITEGYDDAMAVYEALGSQYPVVSVRSASSVKKDLQANFEYINSFEKIYLCFDNDEPGKKALTTAASIFDFNKVYHVDLTKRKDASEYSENKEMAEINRTWWNAKRFMPENVISSYSEIDNILSNHEDKFSWTFPFKRLQDMTYGFRPGECTLFTALEGIGKTEIIRAIEYSVLKDYDHNIGIIHLEEPKARAIKGLIGYELKQPVHLPTSIVSIKECQDAYRTLTKRDDRVHFYSHFGSDDADAILNTIQFLVGACDCRIIFLDHISMVVSGNSEDDERRQLDYISTQLKMKAEALDFALVFVSHINDEGLTRGSRMISKIADTHVRMSRNLIHPDERVRNTTDLTVMKNRFGSKTGPAGKLYFDPDTFMIIEEEENFGLPPVERKENVPF